MKVTPKKYTLKSINYKFTIFIETIKKYRKNAEFRDVHNIKKVIINR
ncbi:hypothetical protein [Klebsiella pneumoniae IS53]|nr:hypothetical protein [Klebsiella pneumoniae IS53]